MFIIPSSALKWKFIKYMHNATSERLTQKIILIFLLPIVEKLMAK